MKLTKEQLKIARTCISADELVEKTATAGVALSREKAQKYLDSVEMVELSEDALELNASGGCSTSGTRCHDCGQLCGTHVYEMMTDTGRIQLCKSCADKRGFKK